MEGSEVAGGSRFCRNAALKLILEVADDGFLLFRGKRRNSLLQGTPEDLDSFAPGLLLPHPDAAPVGSGWKQGPIEIPVAHDADMVKC